jgi:hypothetical protein
MTRRTFSKYEVHRDPRRVDLVEVVRDGVTIPHDRIIRRPGTDYQYDVLDAPTKPVQCNLDLEVPE